MAISSEVTVTSNKAWVLREIQKRLDVGLYAAAEAFIARLRAEYVGLTDHSLGQLARMGHPYGFSPDRQPIPHDPWWYVHTQQGIMSSMIEMHVVPSKGYRFGYLVRAEGKTAETVIRGRAGSHPMIARPFLTAALALEVGVLVHLALLRAKR